VGKELFFVYEVSYRPYGLAMGCRSSFSRLPRTPVQSPEFKDLQSFLENVQF
jgi:hypothetical protein